MLVETIKALLDEERWQLALLGGFGGTVVSMLTLGNPPPSTPDAFREWAMIWVGIFSSIALLTLALLGRGAKAVVHAVETPVEQERDRALKRAKKAEKIVDRFTDSLEELGAASIEDAVEQARLAGWRSGLESLRATAETHGVLVVDNGVGQIVEFRIVDASKFPMLK